jgi:hypothetical protein
MPLPALRFWPGVFLLGPGNQVLGLEGLGKQPAARLHCTPMLALMSEFEDSNLARLPVRATLPEKSMPS